ncbi:MAG: hypothetical protein JXR94_21895 [Candidatus Hydrogenedentes bacterium]|nr:hypothetical protein [Candidatus Hydrogenedentota bacterium]
MAAVAPDSDKVKEAMMGEASVWRCALPVGLRCGMVFALATMLACSGPEGPGQDDGAGPEARAPEAVQAQPEPMPPRPETGTLTSLEAARLAYTEAVKWREDAVFWYMVAHTLHENCLERDWADSDRSRHWMANFANPEDTQILRVYIDGKTVVKTREAEGRDSPCRPEYPKDRPGVSLKEAGRVVFANGAPRDVMPSVCYVIDNMDRQFAGRPVWQFRFEERQEDEGDLYYAFIVDGLNGKLLSIHDAAGHELTAKDLEALRTRKPGGGAGPAHREAVDTFGGHLAKGRIEAALDMLDSTMAPNAEMRRMWAENFGSLKKVKVKAIEEHGREKWKPGLQTYHVTFEVQLKEGAAYCGWEPGVNERWVQIQQEGGAWRIHAIGTGP